MTDRPFSIPELPMWLDERQYILASDLIGEAAGLVGDGTPSGLDDNPEYTRGMAELIMRFMGWEPDLVPAISEAIKATALDNLKRQKST